MGKKTYDQYVEMFAYNNPRVIESIKKYKGRLGDEHGEVDNNTDYTDEAEETSVSHDGNINCSFNYESNLL